MALGIKLLEECDLETKALGNNKWHIKFMSTERVEHSTTVTVGNARIIAYSSGMNNMKMINGRLAPANRIKEENQEQRVINEIGKQQNEKKENK